MLDNIRVDLVGRLVKAQPRVRFEGHEAELIFPADKEHDITISLLAFLKKFLLNHLRVVHKAYELPLP